EKRREQLHPPPLRGGLWRKWVLAGQAVGLGRLLRTAALRPAHSRLPQSLQRPRGLRPAFLLARAFAQPVGLGRLLRTEALLPAQRRVLQSLQLLRQLNRLSPQGPARSPAVPCDPRPLFDKLGLVSLI